MSKKRVPWKEELVKKKRSELNKAYLKNKRLPILAMRLT